MVLLTVALVAPVCGGTITGTVRAEGKTGMDSDASGGKYDSRKFKFAERVNYAEMRDFVVYLVGPVGTNNSLPEKPAQVITTKKVSQRGAMFSPHVLPVVAGTTVEWPNYDEILHNVFSITSGATFDLGLYGEGGSAEYTFKTPGLALINCNVHQAMQANVLVLDTPYFGHPDKDGQFQLDVPAGAGKLMVWHPRAAIQTTLIAAPTADPLALRLVLTKPRVVQHLNKEHKVY